MKVRRSGALTNVSHLWDMSSTGALAKSVLNYIANDVVQYGMVTMVWYSMVKYGMVHYGTVWCGVVTMAWYSMI